MHEATYSEWCYQVSGRLVMYCGRSLAEMPACVESALVTWYRHHVSAFVVAYCLALVAPPVERVWLDADRKKKPNTARALVGLREKGLIA